VGITGGWGEIHVRMHIYYTCELTYLDELTAGMM
jgi:hypothetical protein